LLHHKRSDVKAKKTFPQGHLRFTGHSGWLSARMGMFFLHLPDEAPRRPIIIEALPTQRFVSHLTSPMVTEFHECRSRLAAAPKA
jgi:hypothetical protein